LGRKALKRRFDEEVALLRCKARAQLVGAALGTQAFEAGQDLAAG